VLDRGGHLSDQID